MSFREDPIRNRHRSAAHHYARGAALGAVLVFGPMSCVGRTVMDGATSDASETGGSQSGSGAASSTGAGPSTGGRASWGSGGRLMGSDDFADDFADDLLPADDGPFGTGGAAGETGAGGQGGGTAECELPFEGGECDAAIPVYYHNPQSGLCEPATYGGCGGNENRFETLAECESVCGVVRTGTACEVKGVAYPSGSSNVPDPASCNTCSCDDGAITGCTEIGCPEPCDEGFTLGTECAECGPTDACVTVRTACLPACDSAEECPDGWCSEGICRHASFCG